MFRRCVFVWFVVEFEGEKDLLVVEDELQRSSRSSNSGLTGAHAGRAHVFALQAEQA